MLRWFWNGLWRTGFSAILVLLVILAMQQTIIISEERLIFVGAKPVLTTSNSAELAAEERRSLETENQPQQVLPNSDGLSTNEKHKTTAEATENNNNTNSTSERATSRRHLSIGEAAKSSSSKGSSSNEEKEKEQSSISSTRDIQPPAKNKDNKNTFLYNVKQDSRQFSTSLSEETKEEGVRESSRRAFFSLDPRPRASSSRIKSPLLPEEERRKIWLAKHRQHRPAEQQQQQQNAGAKNGVDDGMLVYDVHICFHINNDLLSVCTKITTLNNVEWN